MIATPTRAAPRVFGSPTTPRNRDFAAGIALVAAFYALVYARALTFVYIEGDDATSIAYHALGRVRALQPPYSAYQSMMDAILGLLPAHEPLLRVFAMLLTAVAAPALVILVALLAWDWAGDLIRIPWPAAVILIPLAAPELIYLGLLYTPALLAMAFAVGAHLVARRAFRAAGARGPRLWLSALLFGIGAACRWDVVAYGSVVATDLWLGPGLDDGHAPKPRRVRFAAAFSWGIAAASAWLAAITLNGYGPAAVLKTLRASGPVEAYPGVKVAAATLQTFATPALVLFAATGLLLLAARRRALLIPILAGCALSARFLPFGVPKWLLVSAPGILAAALVGFSLLWRQPLALRIAILACLLAPWLVGIHAGFGDSAYGPGFEIKPFDRPAHARSAIRPVLGAGALVPTSEGPRPIGGHAWVLLGGGWRRIAQASSADLTRAIHEAISTRLPLLQDLGQGYVVASLAGMGYATRDPWRSAANQPVEARTFTSSEDSPSVRVLHLPDRESLFTPQGLTHLENAAGGHSVVIFGYTSTLRRCYKLAPGSLASLGATAALLDLDTLRAAAAARNQP